jgi:HEAT repeats
MDVAIQQLLMRFAGTLNRRRAYASNHPIVLVAEEQLLDAAIEALRGRQTLSIGVARHELLIDGEPWEARTATARELAGRLHRRGVGAIAMESGINLVELRAALTWLVADYGGPKDVPPNQSGMHITRTAYDLLILDDAIRDAQSAIASLWRVLAEVTGLQPERTEPDPYAELPSEYAGLPLITDDVAPSGAAGFDTSGIINKLRTNLDDQTVARRTAVALMELTNHGVTTTDEGRALIGDQMLSVLGDLGRSSFAPIVKSLGDSERQQKFITQTIDVLPVGDAVTWLETAATASEQNISHQMLRLMTKLSTVADATHEPADEGMFRDAAREFVQGWSLADPNPAQHAELLDRIAGFERVTRGGVRPTGSSSAIIESSRLVQMALELDTVGEDTVAAVESLLANGSGRPLLRWLADADGTPAAAEMYAIVTSEKSIRQLLLTEPVDRLEARALLEELNVSAVDTLIDVLGEAGSKGTRLLVRQRLAEFGEAIKPRLMARLGDGPWYLTRNLLSLLHDTETQRRGEGAAAEAIVSLLGHTQVQVRLEALRVLVGMGDEQRIAALSRALRDENERVVVVALQDVSDAAAVHGELPDALVTQIMALVDAGAQSEPVRARAIRALATTRSDGVRDWLIGIVSRKTAIFRRLTLAEPTLPAVSALHVLTRVYGDDPAAAKVMELARAVGQDARWQVRDAGSSTERAT